MLKRVALAGAASLVLTASAFAQQAQTPANADDCLEAAFDLAQAAEAKQLPDEKFDRIEDMLTQMESHCDADRFKDAMAVAGDIKAAIDGQ